MKTATIPMGDIHCPVEATLGLIGGKYKAMYAWGADYLRASGVEPNCAMQPHETACGCCHGKH